MSALSWGDDPPYLHCPSNQGHPVRGGHLSGVIEATRKVLAIDVVFFTKPLFSLVRLNSYHSMLLDGMFREVEIHIRWQRLTSEPFQRVGFGFCGSSQVHKGGRVGNLKENGNWSFWISSMVLTREFLF